MNSKRVQTDMEVTATGLVGLESCRVEAPSRNPTRFSPVFVLATARSYSSVVTTMIGQHPELSGLPELKLFAYPTIRELEESLPRYWFERGVTHRSPGLLRALGEIKFGGQTRESICAAREWLRERAHWSGYAVLDVLMVHLSPRVAVEKSPENVLSDDALARIASAYPKARYVHLTRHPVTTQRSLQEHLKQTVPNHPQNGEPVNSIVSWYEAHRRILRFTAGLPEDRYIRVKAEDVMNDCREQLSRIAAWLGVRTDDAAIEAMAHPESSPFAKFGPPDSGATGGNDPSFLRDPIPRRVVVPSGLESPRGWAEAPGVWRMVAALANHLGYFGEDGRTSETVTSRTEQTSRSDYGRS